MAGREPFKGFDPSNPEHMERLKGMNAANREQIVNRFSADAVRANEIPQATKPPAGSSSGGRMMDNLVRASEGQGNFASTQQTNEQTYARVAQNIGDCSGSIQRGDLLMLNRFAEHGQVIGNTLTEGTKANMERAVDSCLNVGRIGPGAPSPGG